MQFVESMSPYWRSDDAAGRAFENGTLKLRDRFAWQDYSSPPSKPISHIEFIKILKDMRDGIPAELDCHGASDEVIEEARVRYQQLVQSGKDLGVQLLDVPSTALLPRIRKSTSAFPTAMKLGMNTRSSTKRLLEESTPAQGSDKRRRGGEGEEQEEPASSPVLAQEDNYWHQVTIQEEDYCQPPVVTIEGGSLKE
ncbi:hypothetical protein L210DRAFT_3650750 [Boletus edulis BED1]|uniref:Uncharacterized protein n=1 Tax=Boletus edulis BED1 TaxID=1328754 RepID=A0AAD4BJN5_BOLED|nr:hypothetical protein L210DRAFT_3650750 [Boletus edulis BED1]